MPSNPLKILALDTSTEYCSAALYIDGEVDFRGTQAGQTHSQLVLCMVDELLRAHALRLDRLDGIAYGEGPGSFTGLRIACGVVQGLAFGASLPVVGVGTLLAMAAGSGAERVVCCLDARMQEIYHGAYEYRSGAWCAVHEPSVCPPAAAPAVSGGGWLGCGSGFLAYPEVLETRYAAQLQATEPLHFPHAREVAELAVPRFAANEAVSSEHAAPVYLRDKVALRTDERPSP
ncbi:MAG: tRNA (adenosine(37)-N6)-threonylcarbamoyltransferase complex dimerization subunit type 1 TsaB [Burkholderiales bacterium]